MRILIFALVWLHTTGNICAAKGDNKKQATVALPDTTCYVFQEPESKNINAVRLIVSGNKVTGELKYITLGEPASGGKIEGTIKDDIILADWTYIKSGGYYKIPVAFKVTKNAVYQKATAINADGQPYIPEEGEYKYEFPKVSCEFFP